MRVLVTGGGGFLGSTVIRHLTSSHEIICLDHGRRYDYLKRVFTKNVRLLKGDVQDPEVAARALEGVDVLVHLAGLAGERRCTNDPLKGVLSNVYSTHVLLEAVRRSTVSRIFYASSYWVYSTFSPRILPIVEDTELGTDSVYGAEKVASEEMIRHFGLPHVILRIAALYGCGTGVGTEQETLVGRFTLAALRGEPLEVYGDGQQRIDVVYVDDVGRVISELLGHPRVFSGTYNLGGGGSVSVLEVAEIVRRTLSEQYHCSTRIRFRTAPPGKVWPDKWLAVNKIQQVIAGYPYTSLETGIAATVRHLREVIGH